jgi:uncharacterized OB-fold protein
MDLQRFVGTQYVPPFTAREPVNAAMIDHWCDAMEDRNHVYRELAPPAMLPVWTTRPLDYDHPGQPTRTEGSIFDVLDDAGYTAVIAVNTDHIYVRYLRPGDVLTQTWTVESVSEEKTTALGPGYFVTFLYTYTDDSGEIVGTQRMRLLKYRPAARPAKRPQLVRTRDNAFFWDGVAEGRLLIQRCTACKTLRLPPRPMCGHCNCVEWDTIESSGRGSVYSWIRPRHPQMPAFPQPFVVVVVELDEGVRLLSNLVGTQDAYIGMPVEVVFSRPDGETMLPLFEARR